MSALPRIWTTGSRAQVRRRERGAAMVEGALMFPVLILLFGVILLNGRSHMKALKMQQEARRNNYLRCVSPSVMTADEFGNPFRDTPTGFGGASVSDRFTEDVRPWNIDVATNYRPDNVIAGVAAPASPINPSPVELALAYYQQLAAHLKYNTVFAPTRGADRSDIGRASFIGAYVNFSGETKGFSAHLCQGLLSGNELEYINEHQIEFPILMYLAPQILGAMPPESRL